MISPENLPISPEILQLYRHDTDARATEQEVLERNLAIRGASFADIARYDSQGRSGSDLIYGVRDALPVALLTTSVKVTQYLPFFAFDRLKIKSEMLAQDELRLADLYSSVVAVPQKISYPYGIDKPVYSKVMTPCYVVGRASGQILAVPARQKVSQHLGQSRKLAEPIIEESFPEKSIFEVKISQKKSKELKSRRYKRSITPADAVSAFRKHSVEFVAMTDLMVSSSSIQLDKVHDTISPEMIAKYDVLHEVSALAIRFGVESVLTKNQTD